MMIKKTKSLCLALLFSITCLTSVKAQFGGLKDKLLKIGTAQGAKALGVDKFLKQPAAITTSFEDVNREGEKMPDFLNDLKLKAQPLYLLPKNPDGGFVLCEGLYEMTNKSYCLKAGTFAPSKGDGYMFAPVLGPKEEIVVSILKSAEKHPEVEQHDIQALLWTIIARTKFADYSGQVKVTAIKLLTTKQLTQLEGGALGILPFDVMEKTKEQLPSGVRAVFEAENNIRQLVASGNYTYADLEKYAIVAGMAPPRSDVPSGIWTKHPDGYYVRYFPSGYSVTKVQVYVPKELLANGAKLIYDATGDIACPANTGSQRLAQTNEPLEADYSLKLTTICNPK
ncbi:hypothetical protein [Pedobacter zeae]|uniref:Uncharacterized protein n=1 Tax=Pedobacter zeae TaxID=1737356 RepID=A0A7W6P4G3_9SPHI|nr:hypothetical protein [Pedobacter zeae]MBB4106897.1 hypothetical protein [Pedobacter zeae]